MTTFLRVEVLIDLELLRLAHESGRLDEFIRGEFEAYIEAAQQEARHEIDAATEKSPAGVLAAWAEVDERLADLAPPDDD